MQIFWRGVSCWPYKEPIRVDSGFKREFDPQMKDAYARTLLACTFVALTTAPGLPAQAVQRLSDISQIQSLNDEAPGSHTWWVQRKIAESPGLFRTDALQGDAPPGPDWEAISLPATLPPNGSGPFATFLKRFWLPTEAVGPLSIRLGEIDDRDRTYLNGVLIGQTGDWDSPFAQAYDRLRIYDPPEGAFRPGEVNVLVVQVRGYSATGFGIIRGSPQIGPTAEMHRREVISDFVEVLLQAVYLATGLYFLFLFIRRRKERENLFYGLFSVCFALWGFLRTQLKYELGLSFLILKRAEYTLLFALVPLFFLFVRYYFELSQTRFVRWMDRLSLLLISGFVAAMLGLYLTESAEQWWQIQVQLVQRLWIPCLLVVFGILISRMIQMDRDAFLMTGGVLIVVVGMALDVLSARSVIQIPNVMNYAFSGFILSLALILVNRFVRVNEAVEDLNLNLEAKVLDRTNRLNESLSQLQALKNRQDGDYFLTSRLIRPLGGDQTRSDLVQIRTLTRQKKRFRFRKWKSELGGDLCAAYDVTLKGRPCSVFMNGDAMGKSMQGAGGALVLGTVFKSVVTRTQIHAAAADKHPELWLKDCYRELQAVFAAFDGSMMASAMLGIVDHATATVFYINAEHPAPVLLRDGRADFVSGERQLRKLGMLLFSGTTPPVFVNVLRLRSDDILLCGSDGRDDLAIGLDAKGQRVMNEDERLFLRAVERGRGEPRQIAKYISSTGKLTDDLSLLTVQASGRMLRPSSVGMSDEAVRLAREGEFSRAAGLLRSSLKSAHPGDPALSYLAKLELRAGNAAHAIAILEGYCAARPEDTRALARLMRAYRRLKNHAAAIEAGERVLLRGRTDSRFKISLADSCRIHGSIDRCLGLLREVLAEEPGNPGAMQLRSLLDETGQAR